MLADTDVLDTLSEREFRAGYAEVAKYGLIDKPDFFEWLENNWRDVFAGGAARIEAIAVSCQAKADVAAAARTVAQLSAFACRHAQDVAEIDMNPILVRPEGEGVLVLDALMVPTAHNPSAT